VASIVTSIIGGIQGASASKNAGAALSGAYDSASNLIKNATTAAQGYGATGLAALGTGLANATSAVTGGVQQANDSLGVGMTNANKTLADVYGTAGSTTQPYRDAGAAAVGTLSADMAPGGSLNTPFNASMMEANDPGYQFRLQQGEQALQRSAAAAGGQMGGGAAKSLARYSQGLASSEYGAAFDRYTKQQQQTYGMLSGVAGMGQQADAQFLQAGQNFGAGTSANTMAATGQAAANTVHAGDVVGADTMSTASQTNQGNQWLGTVGMQGAQQQGADAIGAGQAKAQGIIGSANAWNGMLSGIGNGVNSILYGGFGGGGGFSPTGAISGVPNWGGGYSQPSSSGITSLVNGAYTAPPNYSGLAPSAPYQGSYSQYAPMPWGGN
jgi:hypothetical protein